MLTSHALLVLVWPIGQNLKLTYWYFFIVALKHDQESEKAGYLIMIQINGQKVK